MIKLNCSFVDFMRFWTIRLKSWAYQRMLQLHPLMEEFEEELPHYLSIINEGETEAIDTALNASLIDDVLQAKRTRELFSLLVQVDHHDAQRSSMEATDLSKIAIVDFLATRPNDDDNKARRGDASSHAWEIAN